MSAAPMRREALPAHPSVHVVRHPMIAHKLGLMRCADVSTKGFRELAAEVANLLTYEATRDLDTEFVTVEGWAGPVSVERIQGKKVTVVPILRAGLGMMSGVLQLIPSAKVSVVGLYRNESTLEPVRYYEKWAKNIEHRLALILDPMLATGGSMARTIEMLKAIGCPSIRALTIVSAPEGLGHVVSAHPDVHVFTAAVDEGLNERGYILPGLGDAGDKIFGTK